MSLLSVVTGEYNTDNERSPIFDHIFNTSILPVGIWKMMPTYICSYTLEMICASPASEVHFLNTVATFAHNESGMKLSKNRIMSYLSSTYGN